MHHLLAHMRSRTPVDGSCKDQHAHQSAIPGVTSKRMPQCPKHSQTHYRFLTCAWRVTAHQLPVFAPDSAGPASAPETVVSDSGFRSASHSSPSSPGDCDLNRVLYSRASSGGGAAPGCGSATQCSTPCSQARTLPISKRACLLLGRLPARACCGASLALTQPSHSPHISKRTRLREPWTACTDSDDWQAARACRGESLRHCMNCPL